MDEPAKPSRFSPVQVLVASLLGGALGGTSLVALNLHRDERYFAAWTCFSLGIVLALTILLLATGGNPVNLLLWWERSREPSTVGLLLALGTWITTALIVGSMMKALGTGPVGCFAEESWGAALLIAALGLAMLALLAVAMIMVSLAVAFSTGR